MMSCTAPPETLGVAQEVLPILWCDDALVAVHKPPGLLVHRSEIDRHETRNAVDLLRAQLPGFMAPVHRLDKPTSGVLLFARSADIARIMAQEFEAQNVQKAYWAVVRGWPERQGLIDHPLARVQDDYTLIGRKGEAQAAQTQYNCLQTCELPFAVDRYASARYALLSLQPFTGRQHQIRRHLKHIAHPIIGDVNYGKGTHNRFFREQFGSQRLLLACVALRFRHPLTGMPLQIDAPVDAEFARVLRETGLALS